MPPTSDGIWTVGCSLAKTNNEVINRVPTDLFPEQSISELIRSDDVFTHVDLFAIRGLQILLDKQENWERSERFMEMTTANKEWAVDYGRISKDGTTDVSGMTYPRNLDFGPILGNMSIPLPQNPVTVETSARRLQTSSKKSKPVKRLWIVKPPPVGKQPSKDLFEEAAY